MSDRNFGSMTKIAMLVGSIVAANASASTLDGDKLEKMRNANNVEIKAHTSGGGLTEILSRIDRSVQDASDETTHMRSIIIIGSED